VNGAALRDIENTNDPHQAILSRMLGWDIGGVNTKAARVVEGRVADAVVQAFELQRDPAALVPLLGDLARRLDARPGTSHAVTMTAELSQMFRTKREGVAFVLDAVESAFPESDICVFGVDGEFLRPADARRAPLRVAAANWAATARMVALSYRDAVLVDVGTTTTDIIPIVAGRVVARGRTDPERLASGELVYSGVLRTPVEAIVATVPYGSGVAGVSAEGFALAGDVHLWRGNLDPVDYTVPAPDGRPASREFCGERLARVICADREMLDEPAIDRIADAIAGAQVARLAGAIRQVAARHPRMEVAVVAGAGAFLASAAVRAAGLTVVDLGTVLDCDAARCAPAAAVALLGEQARRRAGEDRLHV
jgi:probable H4MPT-linked C1 transfer pathway protein